MTTRLAWDRYLELVERDSTRLAEVARRGLDVDVPSCPGWTMADLVEHVAVVYEHKIVCVRTLEVPTDWPPPVPPGDPVDRLDAARDELVGLLRERGPEAPAATWWPDDQTTGFWYRRMAHEAAVHRIDAELAVGEPTPVDAELAVDGIDEVLQVFLAGDWSEDDWGSVDPEAGAGRTVAVLTGDHVWRVTLGLTGVEVVEGAGEVAGSVGGDASALLLWLWRRVGTEQVEVSGDADAVAALHDRLVLATQ